MRASIHFFPVIFSGMLILSGCNHPHSSYNILDYGAVGDGHYLNTAAINKTISDCNAHGGGTVVIPRGNYISGTIILLSDVNLFLEPGAVITGSKDTSDYKVMDDALFKEGYNRYGLLYAGDAKNISITGQGEIFGNGTYFMNGIDKPHIIGDYDRKLTRQGEEFMKPGSTFEDGPLSYPFRPGLMMVIRGCEHVLISGILLKDSPEWTIRIGDCDDVVVHGITILNNPLIPNNDGIHCTNSRNVRISDCNISAGDDAIIVTGFGNLPVPSEGSFNPDTLKMTGNKTGYAENITVTNCVLSSRSACIRVGYGVHPIRNLIFSNLVMYSSNRGIGVFSRDSSSIENVLFSNITIHTRLQAGDWWGKGEPIHISAIKSSKNGNSGKINNIRFSNIVATGEAGILIWSEEENRVENILFENIQLTLKGGKHSGSFGGNFDLRPAFPVNRTVFKHDIPGFYARYVKNLKISGFEMKWGNDLPSFFTSAVEADHFDGITINDFTGDPATGTRGLPAIKLSDGKNAEIRNSKTTNGSTLVIKDNVK
jgi:hypothetical protein